MNINRHNYEEYFILYMDNELNIEDRRMVDAFVIAHPDLREELDNLLQYKLEPETEMVFPDKENLKKLQNEELLLLYIDNELSKEEQLNVATLLKNNPALNKEHSILLQTKLFPEQIIFAHKEDLYREEEKVKPLVFRWQKFAIAAALLLTIGLSGILLLRKTITTQGKEIVQTKPEVRNQEPKTVSNIQEQGKQVLKQADENNMTVSNLDAKPNKLIYSAHPILQTQHIVKEQNISQAVSGTVNEEIKPNTTNSNYSKNEIAIEKSETNNLPSPINNINATRVIPATLTEPIVAKIDSKPETDNIKNNQQPEIINASLTTNSINNNASLEKGKNKNSRGFIRKITRVLLKGNKALTGDENEDNKILVGGFAIHL